ncbi:MAG: recombinase family protein [Dehalococcoidia bacterium]
MKPVAVYARVSTEDQGEKGTIDVQLHACREYADRLGYTIVATYCDEGISGTVPLADRPQGAALMEAAEAGMFQATIVYCVDRLGRSVTEALLAHKALSTLDAPVEFVLQSFDGSPEGMFQFQIFCAVAEYERANIVRRMTQGRYRRVREGKHMASVVAYGYRRNGHGLEVDEAEAGVVRKVYRWCVEEDMGLFAIASRLNDLGITPSRHYTSPAKAAERWGPSSVGKILRAERYTGKGRYGPEVATYPPIIDEVTFAAAGRALRRRRQFNKGGTKSFYLLQHIARCKACGTTCTPNHQGRNRLVAYTCNGWARGKSREGHGRYRWYARDVEPQVTEWVLRLLRDPRAVLREVELLQEAEFQRIEEKSDQEAAWQRRLAELGAEEQRVLEWGRRGYMNEAAMLAQLDQVNAERKELTEALAAMDTEAEDYDPLALSADFREWAIRHLSENLGESDVPGFLKKWVRAVWLDDEGGVTVEGVLPIGEEVQELAAAAVQALPGSGVSLSRPAAEGVEALPGNGVVSGTPLPAQIADNLFPPS